MLAGERETSIAYSDEDDKVLIYSCIRKDITAMKKKDQFELVEEGAYEDGTIWAQFSIDRDKFDVGRAAKTTRNLSPESRAKLSERMSKLHSNKKEDE